MKRRVVRQGSEMPESEGPGSHAEHAYPDLRAKKKQFMVFRHRRDKVRFLF